MTTSREDFSWLADSSLSAGGRPSADLQLQALIDGGPVPAVGGLVVGGPPDVAPARAAELPAHTVHHQGWASAAEAGRADGGGPSEAAGGSGGPIRLRGKRAAAAAGFSAPRAPERRSPPTATQATTTAQHLAMLNAVVLETFKLLGHIQREAEKRQAALGAQQREAAQQAAQQELKIAVLAAGVREIKAQAAQTWEKYDEVLKAMRQCERANE